MSERACDYKRRCVSPRRPADRAAPPEMDRWSPCRRPSSAQGRATCVRPGRVALQRHPRTTDAGLRTRKPVEGGRRHSQGGACANLRDRPLSTLRNSARARRLRSPIYKSTLRLSSIVSTKAKQEPQAQEKRQGGAYKRRGGQNTTRSQSCSPSLSLSLFLAWPQCD